jgi:hypothetical protein
VVLLLLLLLLLFVRLHKLLVEAGAEDEWGNRWFAGAGGFFVKYWLILLD